MWAVIFAGLLAFLVFLVAHVCVFRLREVQARTKTMALILAASSLLLPWLIPFWRERLGPTADAAFGFPIFVVGIFTLIWFGYLQFYSAFDTSPSLRFLIEVLGGGGALTAAELKARYDFDDVFRRRVERAVVTGYLLKEARQDRHYYSNSPRAQRIGAWSSLIKDFLRLGKGG